MGRFFNYPGESSSPGLGSTLDRIFWASRAAADWRAVLEVAQTLRFRAGETALEIGETTSSVFVVASGRFAVGVGEAGEGEAFGMAGFFSQTPATEAVVAIVDSEVVRIGRSQIDRLSLRHPELARDLLFEFGRLLTVAAQ